MENATKLNLPVVWGGDMNIDLNERNDSFLRADLRELKPMMKNLIISNNLALINTQPTWFRPGRQRSLLDIYLMSHPFHVIKCNNVTNMLSEHDGVLLELNLSLEMRKAQFITTRDYRRMTWENMEPLVASNKDLTSNY